METVERTDISYLRPHQVQDMKREEEILLAKMQSPHIENKGAVGKQLNHLRKSFETQAPKAPETADEEGRLVSRERELRSQIVSMMCSQEEMRMNPPGAVGKFNAGENGPRGKKLITEWKNIQLRLNPGTSDGDVANIERHRPTRSTLNLDNAQIARKQYYMGPADAALPVAFDAQQLAVLEQIAPDIRERLATLNNLQRADVRDLIQTAKGEGLGLADAHTPDPVKSAAGKAGAEKKRAKSQKQLDALARGRATAAANKAAREVQE